VPLSSTAEQIYFSGVNQGFGPNDDAGMVRFYHPEPVKAVDKVQLANGQDDRVGVITRMLVAIHICAAAEAIAFARHLKIPLDQFYELVNAAAGASAMFRKCFEAMRDGKPENAKVGSLDTNIASLCEAIDEAQLAKCPLPLANAALNQMLLAKRREGGEKSAAYVISNWE